MHPGDCSGDHGCDLVPIQGDGHCFFRAFAAGLGDEDIDCVTMRMLIVKTLPGNNARQRTLSSGGFQSLIQMKARQIEKFDLVIYNADFSTV